MYCQSCIVIQCSYCNLFKVFYSRYCVMYSRYCNVCVFKVLYYNQGVTIVSTIVIKIALHGKVECGQSNI